MPRGPERALVLLVALAGLAFGLAPPALAQSSGASSGPGGDFATTNAQWNGLSGVLDVAREEDADLVVVSHLDLGTLTPSDGLLVVYPDEPLPTDDLSNFMRAGGRVAVADDFGAAETFFRAFRIGRGEPHPDAPSILRLRGNRELLVARPITDHPLTEGVGAVVTNHPRVLFHAELQPILAVGERDAVVLAGAVGEGRLVAIGDPSVLINNMLELEGNRRFASNLLLYLRGDAHGRIYLLEPGGELAGRYGEPGADRPLHDLRALLERISSFELPPLALRILAFSVVVILLILVAGVLPRTSPYRADSMFREEPVAGGLSGRVEWYRARATDLLEPTLVYKLELEAALTSQLGLKLERRSPDRANPQEMLAAMQSRGLPAQAREDARRLLDELAGLASGATNGTAPPVTEARFRNLVARGEAILEALGGKR
ncbi:MAG: DUF4350 domain-containing protein [Sandaracinaceae bacterium]|nr:DUF4350 domain-containing protein [Sandaracinaceae bacterium]